MYHGIASYKFEYKLTSSNDWISKETIVTNENASKYTYTGLREKTSYDFRVTATDKAGNTNISAVKTGTTAETKDNTPPNAPNVVISGTTRKKRLVYK